VRTGRIDLTDLYSTDARIDRLGLAVLDDARGFFPAYAAGQVVREALAARAAPVRAPLAGAIDAATMRRLNARVELEGVPFAVVAGEFLAERGLATAAGPGVEPLPRRLGRRTLEHLALTSAALLAAVLLAVLLGVLAWWRPALGRVLVPLTGLLQTIPSIALLALLIPLCGIGWRPAVVALFAYGLLPIVRNTHAGLASVEPQYRTIAAAMGLGRWQTLRLVELPLALPVLLAGVKTAAVINIGTATLAAFIGAGGLGEPIVTGLALNDHRLVLEGALPAAGLALGTELAFQWFERRFAAR
jgi:osmoprotectant transport system permease protein